MGLGVGPVAVCVCLTADRCVHLSCSSEDRERGGGFRTGHSVGSLLLICSVKMLYFSGY